MCLQCGCGRPYDDMGEPEKNLIVDNIKKSVTSDAAKGITTEQAIKNIVDTWNSKVKEEDKKFQAAD
ncbi:MAG TPA: hypothetical protein VLG47_00780 [Candidatus Saccharimonadales bacterium]|nr:hypothetical protein [Candidatus Saccharimonadales bacterium]